MTDLRAFLITLGDAGLVATPLAGAAQPSDNPISGQTRGLVVSRGRRTVHRLAVRRGLLSLFCVLSLNGCHEYIFLGPFLAAQAIENGVACRKVLSAARSQGEDDVRATGITIGDARGSLLDRPWYRADLRLAPIAAANVSEVLTLTTQVIEQVRSRPGSRLALRGEIDGEPFSIHWRTDCASVQKLDTTAVRLQRQDELIEFAGRLLALREFDFDVRGITGSKVIHIERDIDRIDSNSVERHTEAGEVVGLADAYERLAADARRAQDSASRRAIRTTVEAIHLVADDIPRLVSLLALVDAMPPGSEIGVQGFVDPGAGMTVTPFKARFETRANRLTLRLKGL